MERAIAEMEKIRRAEEIYSKRRNSNEIEKKINSKNIYKVLFEILVNSYNVNLKKKIEGLVTSSKVEKSKEKPKQENTVTKEKSASGESNNVTSKLVENQPVEKELSQEEKDIKEVKDKYSVIKPIDGVKTSGFGERESTNSKVTKYHTGIDIAANTGTVITSATEGKVIEVSSSGDYGKHFKVQIGDLIVLYAHCSKIYVKEGQEVKQGDKIAEVGSTRKFNRTSFAF